MLIFALVVLLLMCRFTFPSFLLHVRNEYEKKKQAVEKMLIQLVLKVDTTVPKQRIE